MITGDQLAIGKGTVQSLGMSSNMCPSTTLLDNNKTSETDGLIQKENRSARMILKHKCEIMKWLDTSTA